MKRKLNKILKPKPIYYIPLYWFYKKIKDPLFYLKLKIFFYYPFSIFINIEKLKLKIIENYYKKIYLQEYNADFEFYMKIQHDKHNAINKLI